MTIEWCLIKIPLAEYRQAGQTLRLASFKVMSTGRAAVYITENEAVIVKKGDKEDLQQEAERLNQIDVKF